MVRTSVVGWRPSCSAAMRLLAKSSRVGDAGGRGADVVVEAPGPGVGFFDGLLGASGVVEGLNPGGKLRAPVGGGDEVAGGMVEPEGSVGGMAAGEDRGTVFERDAEELRLAARGENDFVAQGAGELVAG